MVYGDPYLIENVDVRLYNPSNFGDSFYCQPNEEFLHLTANDGAAALLYDVPTIYHFEMG